MAAFDLQATSLALRRLLLPLSNESWPRRNVLVLARRPQRLAVGADFEVEVSDKNGRLPPRVVLEYAPLDKAAGDIRSRPMKPVGDRMVARLENVTESIRYRAIGGDDDTMDWQVLEVVEPPRIGELRVRLFPPDYMRLPPESSGRHIRAWAGTRVTMAGRIDKPVKAVTLVVQSQGSRHRRPVAVARDGLGFTLPASPSEPWVLEAPATYHFELRDRNDFVAADLAGSELHVQKDAPPTVSLASPNSGAYFTAEALVPIRAIAKDDVAIRSIELEYGDQRRDLFRAVDAPGAAKLPDVAPPKLGETRVVEHEWNLAELPQLRPGDVIEFRLAVSDRQPQYGYTSPTRLLIISADELETRIDQRQTGLGQKLREALDDSTQRPRAIAVAGNTTARKCDSQPADRRQPAERGTRSAPCRTGAQRTPRRSGGPGRFVVGGDPEQPDRAAGTSGTLDESAAGDRRDLPDSSYPSILFDVTSALKLTRNLLASNSAADRSGGSSHPLRTQK